jgi:hypothetical protein
MQKLDQYPIICPGNQLIQLINGTYYIGSSRRGFCFKEAERFRFLQYCNGKREIHEISKIIGTDAATLNQFLVDGLSSRYLINLSQSSTLPALSSDVGSFGVAKDLLSPKLKTRRDCEYDFYLRKIAAKSKHSTEKNSSIGFLTTSTPAELFNSRAKQEILIFGTNQFTIQLLATLQSAGFSRSRVIGSFGKDHSQVIADDLSGTVIQSSDVGSTITQISKRISREHQLVNAGNLQISSNTKPSLIIAMQPIPADYQQRWLSESTPHLVIGSIIENQIEIGPIVLPGSTTCLRCIDLTLVANALAPEIATLNHLNTIERLPAAVLSMLVGMVTIFATEYLDLNSPSSNKASIANLMHPLISAALRIDLANPCKQAHIKWQPNSMCGCGADLAEYANGQVQV